jgi:succinoglycan biosynthesis protein ExoU
MAKALDICVVIAAKNASATVGRSVASALRQVEAREVIVVDDGSTDRTAAIAAEADDRSGRLRVIQLEANAGPSTARNRAIADSEAALVSILDADDYLADGRFARMLANAGSEWDLLADDLFLASEATPDAPTRRLLGVPEGQVRQLDVVEFVGGNLADPRRPRGELGYLKPLMNRDFLARSNLAYDESLRLGEDFVLYAQALLRGARFVLMPACGYVAVEHAGSLSHRHGTAEVAALAAADARLIDEARNRVPHAVPVLETHRRGVQLKLDHHLVLDARRRGDWPEVARRLVRTPATIAYVLGQTLQAKARLGRRAPNQALPAGRSV